jgi:hypothetical protein
VFTVPAAVLTNSGSATVKCPAGCADRPRHYSAQSLAITEIFVSNIGNVLSMAISTVLIVPFIDLLTASG